LRENPAGGGIKKPSHDWAANQGFRNRREFGRQVGMLTSDCGNPVGGGGIKLESPKPRGCFHHCNRIGRRIQVENEKWGLFAWVTADSNSEKGGGFKWK
jgi:hypothetical protein